MAVRYQVDGDIFREITPNWLCASISEFFIKARQVATDQTGNTIEYFQLNDGRIFERPVPSFQPAEALREPQPRAGNMQPALCERPLTQS
jgi:hypothetical protein